MISFASRFPLATSRGLAPVNPGSGDHEGFDELELKAKLGDGMFGKLCAAAKEVFVCGHALYPADHEADEKRGTEVHCFYARDVEALIEKERE